MLYGDSTEKVKDNEQYDFSKKHAKIYKYYNYFHVFCGGIAKWIIGKFCAQPNKLIHFH